MRGWKEGERESWLTGREIGKRNWGGGWLERGEWGGGGWWLLGCCWAWAGEGDVRGGVRGVWSGGGRSGVVGGALKGVVGAWGGGTG